MESQGTKRKAESSDTFVPCKLARQEEVPLEDISAILGMMTTMLPRFTKGQNKCCFKRAVAELVHIAGHIEDCDDDVEHDSCGNAESDLSSEMSSETAYRREAMRHDHSPEL